MNFMREFLILLLAIFLGGNSVFAYELILPKEKKSIVNTKYAFFIGKASNAESIVINDERVYVASNGAFAHSVKLKDGENRVVIRSNINTQVYKIVKTPREQVYKKELLEFDPTLYKVKKDETPLRKTPVDYGMNRISHLFKDTYLVINGEKEDFYRVFLSKNETAWIAKSAVVRADCLKEPPCFLTMNSKTYKNASVHTIEFTEKLPYSISENNDEIIFKVYNPLYSEDSVYTVNIRKPQKYVYNTTLSNGVYVFKVTEFPCGENKSLDGLVITVDAGHGGSEKGAIGCLGDEEKKINLLIAQELKNRLALMGATVIMTRECDANVSLQDRVKLAQENCSNIFISVHLNSIPDIPMNIHKNKGTSVYYYNKNSKQLAQILEDIISKTVGTRKDGVREGSFAVIRPTNYVGVLVEAAYMTNPVDSVLYRSETFTSDVAKAISEAVLEFVTLEAD